MNETLGFPELVERYRNAAPGAELAAEIEAVFDDNTHNWAELVIGMHAEEYGIAPEDVPELWEIVKKAGLTLLKSAEPEIFSLGNFMDFYMNYAHQALLAGYFDTAPRRAEILRKNVKWKLFSEEILPALEKGELKNLSGRKVAGRAYNPPVYDAWTGVKEKNYPETFDLILRLLKSGSGEGKDAENGASAAAGPDEICEKIEMDKIDIRIRRSVFDEVEAGLKEMMEPGWNYDVKPYEDPKKKTGEFFRNTLNWFLMNYLFRSEEYRECTDELISDLEAAERYNVKVENLDEPFVGALMKSFGKHGPSDFFSERNVGVKSRNFGILFDKIANHVFNRLIVPELAVLAEEDWCIER